MVTKVRSKLSYPYIASSLALFLALTGGALALPGKNTVDSGDIKRNAVRSSDIKSPNGVKSGDVKNNDLKGIDINESTLGKVPSAASADNAQALSGNTVVAEGDLDGPGGLTNSSCLAVSEPVPGVQPGDHVVLTPPSGWPTYEINLTARVTADTVTYEICNQSGALANFGFAPPLRFLVFR